MFPHEVQIRWWWWLLRSSASSNEAWSSVVTMRRTMAACSSTARFRYTELWAMPGLCSRIDGMLSGRPAVWRTSTRALRFSV